MSPVNLRSLQKNIHSAYFADGVYDLVIGLIYLSIGLGVWINQAFWYTFPILILVVPLAIKRWITFPRTGHIQIASKNRYQLGFVLFIAELGMAAFLVLLGTSLPSENPLLIGLAKNIFIVIGFIVLLSFIMFGKILNFQRLYLYGFLSLLGFALINRPLPAGIMVSLLGLIISLFSILVMRNFVRHHPKQEQV